MAWKSNSKAVVAALLAQRGSIDSKAAKGANQGLLIGIGAVQERTPVDTANLKNGYQRASKVEKIGDGQYRLTWTSDADYQPFVEFRQPHLRPGIAVCKTEIAAQFKKALEE